MSPYLQSDIPRSNFDLLFWSGGVKHCHKWDYNIEEALEVQPVNVIVEDLWSDKDRRAFELGLKLYGKDFHLIQTKKVPTKTVAEIIQFYYCQKVKSKISMSPKTKRLQRLSKRFTKN